MAPVAPHCRAAIPACWAPTRWRGSASHQGPEADRLARELAAQTGESLTEAVVVALRERLTRERGRAQTAALRSELAAIRAPCAALPRADHRTAEQIIGHDEQGLPG